MFSRCDFRPVESDMGIPRVNANDYQQLPARGVFRCSILDHMYGSHRELTKPLICSQSKMTKQSPDEPYKPQPSEGEDDSAEEGTGRAKDDKDHSEHCLFECVHWIRRNGNRSIKTWHSSRGNLKLSWQESIWLT